jgi:hydroxymethylpyrimidine/phosphomethylpyrimidine kinase
MVREMVLHALFEAVKIKTQRANELEKQLLDRADINNPNSDEYKKYREYLKSIEKTKNRIQQEYTPEEVIDYSNRKVPIYYQVK